MSLKVTIITVCYNAGETIADSLISLDTQSWENWEHIIVDGGSTDSTQEIIAERSDPRRSVRSGPDNGVYDAMNKGLASANGDVIGFLNADDFFADSECLADIAALFERHIDLDFTYGNLTYVDRFNPSCVRRLWNLGVIDDFKLAVGAAPAHPTFYIRDRVLSLVEEFSLDYALASDYHFMLRCLRSEQLKGIYQDRFLVVMREGGMTSNGLWNVIKQNIEILRIRRRLREKGSALIFLLRKLIYKRGQFV